MRSTIPWLSAFPLFTALAFAGCASAPGESTVSDNENLTASSGRYRVTITAGSASAGRYALQGTTSSTLGGAFAFVPDDEIGATTVSGKTFTNAFAGSEMRGFVAGQPVFESITLANGGHFTARADLKVAPVRSGTQRITLDSTFTTYQVGGTDVVRITGAYSTRLVSVRAAFIGPDPKPEWTGTVSGKTFRVDVPAALVADAIANGALVGVVVGDARDEYSTSFTPILSPVKVKITTGDAYDVWPAPTCTATLKACFARTANKVDTSACGDAYTVHACPGAPAQLCGDALKSAFDAATANLLYSSESDYPFEDVDYEGAGTTALTSARLLSLIGAASNTPVVVRSVEDELAWQARNDSTMTPEEAATAAQFRALEKVLHDNLTDVKVYRVGTIQVQLYFVGTTKCGAVAGVKSIAIET